MMCGIDVWMWNAIVDALSWRASVVYLSRASPMCNHNRITQMRSYSSFDSYHEDYYWMRRHFERPSEATLLPICLRCCSGS